MATDSTKNVDVFVRLLAKHQGQIYSYILSLVGNFNDADDVLQETSSKLWELFDQFEPGTDFLKWSLSVAHYRVLDFRKKAQRNRRVVYTEDFFEFVSDSAPKRLSATSEYLEKLKNCLEKLQPADASIIKMRYLEARRAKEIASQINRTVRNVYFTLARIQRLLLRCMNGSG